MKFGISINSNEDLNNLTEIGTYYSASSTITASLTNCPMSTYGFFMIVSYATGTDPLFIRQTIYGRTDNFAPIMYARHKSSSEWGEWYSFSNDATLFAGKAINSGDDLNNYKTPGIYCSPQGSVTQTLLNMPEIFSAAFTMLIFNPGQMPLQVIIRGGTTDAVYIRVLVNGVWRSWYKFAGTIISS